MRTALHALAALLCLGAPSFAQILSVPAPDGTLSVTLVGTAEADPDFAEINLSVATKGATAAAALEANRVSRDDVVARLTAAGAKSEAISWTAPRLAASGLGYYLDDEEEGERFRVTTTVTVRTAAGTVDEVYTEAARLIDAAAAAGAGPMDSLNVTDLLSGGSIVTFGVNNERALRDRALSDGMAQARELATAAVAKAGRKLGEVSGLQIQSATDSTLMKALTVMGAPISPGKAHYQIFIAVTFKVQ
jgi:uncharacterized protein YggE